MTYPLYSNAVPTALGNMNFTGDLYEVGRPFADLRRAVQQHLNEAFPTTALKVGGSNKFGRRRLEIAIHDTDVDLTDPTKRDVLLAAISDEVWRFGFDKSNPTTDFRSLAFDVDISVSDIFWARRQRQTGPDLIEDTINLSTFKNELHPGHILEIAKAAQGVGNRHHVLEVARRIVVDDGVTGKGRIYWNFPKATAFLCDGTHVRIAEGTIDNPDAYKLLNWIRQ